MKVKFSHIDWDNDGPENLPDEVTIDVDPDVFDTTSQFDMEEALSEHFGYLLYDCEYEVL